MGRIFKRDGRTVIMALDYGTFIGTLPAWIDPAPTIEAAVSGGADAIMTTLGIAERYSHLLIARSSLILSTPLFGDMQNMAETALRLGADSLKVFVPVGTADDSQVLSFLWNASLACKERGLPLMAEMFPVKSEKTPNPTDKEVVARFSRIGAEYGADFIKTFYTESAGSFRSVIEACPAPVVAICGEKAEDAKDLLQGVSDAMSVGAAGIVVGRKVWQHKNVKGITRALSKVVHQMATVDKALKA